MPPLKNPVRRSRRPAPKTSKAPRIEYPKRVKVPKKRVKSAKVSKGKPLQSRRAERIRTKANHRRPRVVKAASPRKVPSVNRASARKKPLAIVKVRNVRKPARKVPPRISKVRKGTAAARVRKAVGTPPRSGRVGRDLRKVRRLKVGSKVPHKVSKSARAPSLTRPAAWWRHPISAEDLGIIQGDNADDLRAFVVAQKRLELVEGIKDDIRKLRVFSTKFGPDNGYFFDSRRIVRMTASQIKKLRLAIANLKRAEGRAHVTFHPKTDKQRRAALRQAGEIIPGQKRFLIHGVSGSANVRAVWRPKEGLIEIVETIPKHKKGRKTIPEIQLFNRTYFFPRKPKSWDDIREMTDAIMRTGMQHGRYQINNDLYGPIGRTIDRSMLDQQLQEYFAGYEKGFAGTIIGWTWVGTSAKSAFARKRKATSAAERFKVIREYTEYKRERRIMERLGIAKRCRKCKKMKCRCRLPKF